MMKIRIQFLLIFLLFVSTGFSQTKSDILSIKEKYVIISELLEKEHLVHIALENSCNNNGQIDASLTFYYSNDILLYILHTYSEGHDNYINHYYIHDNKLFFYFSDYASWIWDYECTPEEQGFTNEIWTYEEQRIYFNNNTPIKCLHKKYTEKSIDQPYQNQIPRSDMAQNKEEDCDKSIVEKVLSKYLLLRNVEKNKNQNICDISID